jgi:hypothetical protein
MIPKIAHHFTFESSNGCENIFTKEGRKQIIKDSNLHVMTSEVNATDYKKLQNISAFLKGENSIILLQIIQKSQNCSVGGQ